MIELAADQDLSLTDDGGRPLTRVRMGLGWQQEPGSGPLGSGGRREVDLDASAYQFAGGELFDLVFFNNARTRDGSVVHLGDNKTGAGEGDDEAITVDLGRVHGPVDRIVLLVSSYHGHSLEWVWNAYCRLVDEAAEPEAELARFTLTEGVTQTGIVMATLVRSEAGWTLHAVGEGVDVTNPAQAAPRLRRFVG